MIDVSIDPGLCRGHQMCILGVPDVFTVGDDEEGKAAVLVRLQSDQRLNDLRSAAASCPERAIRIQKVDGP